MFFWGWVLLSQGNLQVTAPSDLVRLVRPSLPSVEMTYATPEVKMTTKPTYLMRVITVLTVPAPQCVFHLRTRRTISIFVRRLQASLLWTLTPCLFSAAHPQRPLECNTTEMEINGGRAQAVLVNRSQFPLRTTTLAALSLQILAPFLVKVGGRLPPSSSLLNSGRNPLRRKQMFRLHPHPYHLSLPPLPQWRNVKLQWQMEKSQEPPTNTAAHSAQRARHQP